MNNNQETKETNSQKTQEILNEVSPELRESILKAEKELKREVMKKAREYAQAQKNFDKTQSLLEGVNDAFDLYRCREKHGISEATLKELSSTMETLHMLLHKASDELSETKYNFEDEFKANL